MAVDSRADHYLAMTPAEILTKVGKGELGLYALAELAESQAAEIERLTKERAWLDRVGPPDHPDDERHWAMAYVRAKEEAAAARTNALEEAALICESVNNYDNPMTAGDCADAIRALGRPAGS